MPSEPAEPGHAGNASPGGMASWVGPDVSSAQGGLGEGKELCCAVSRTYKDLPGNELDVAGNRLSCAHLGVADRTEAACCWQEASDNQAPSTGDTRLPGTASPRPEAARPAAWLISKSAPVTSHTFLGPEKAVDIGLEELGPCSVAACAHFLSAVLPVGG